MPNWWWTLPPERLKILKKKQQKTQRRSHLVALVDKREAERELKNYRLKSGVRSQGRQHVRGGIGMIPNLPMLDQAIFREIEQSEEKIEEILDCDAVYFYGEIRIGHFQAFRNVIEELSGSDKKKSALAVCLKTPGGEAETVEKMVDVIREHYKSVYFIVPEMAMSAGTIFCMAGDKIYMDYSSSLGPIDPQVPDKEGKYLVPALGYLDKIEELVQKSLNDTISPAEFAILEKQDLAMLRYYEQAKTLSEVLLENWLATYKFKDWKTHRTTNRGTPVTKKQKRTRAKEIAAKLSDNNHWHSHGRMIGPNKLWNELRLEIDRMEADSELQQAVRSYSDMLSDWLSRSGILFFLYNRNIV